jgi:hypothetical protein
MRGRKDGQELMLTLTTPETVVPQDHPIRPLKALVDEQLASLNPVFKKMYSFEGRPSIPPKRLVKVIHLFSRPHTPQHNPWVERGIGEGKALAELNADVNLQSRAAGVQRLNDALQTLNNHWPRQSRGGLTAAQLEKKLPQWNKLVSRDEFYAAADAAIQEAVTEANGRKVRQATREAIFRTLERFGLILRTRGE